MTKTKKATPKKAAGRKAIKVDPKRLAKIEKILEGGEEEGEGEGEGEGAGKIHMILTLHTKGFTNAEIVAAGFNRSTVYRQTGEYKKLKKAPATEYQGFTIYEGNIQRIMKSKNLSRDKAVELINKKMEEL